METKEKELREQVRSKYASIALSNGKESCCGPEGCDVDYNLVGEDYDTLKGYAEDADLGLGCGLPTKFAKIEKGQTVVDLGSGAGNDVFIAREETGNAGRVIGIDFTEQMIHLANQNNQKLGYDNVEFRHGSIEDIPLKDGMTDVVVSNCVFNLVPNKKQAFKETFRILKPGGHFSISDIVVDGPIPEDLRIKAEEFAGCVSGAIQKDQYLELIDSQGFKNIVIQKYRRIELPNDLLAASLDEATLAKYDNDEMGIYSLSVYAEKPESDECCETSCCN